MAQPELAWKTGPTLAITLCANFFLQLKRHELIFKTFSFLGRWLVGKNAWCSSTED